MDISRSSNTASKNIWYIILPYMIRIVIFGNTYKTFVNSNRLEGIRMNEADNPYIVDSWLSWWLS